MITTATNSPLHKLLSSIGNETLQPQPDFQRRLVWTNKDKLAFISTVLSGYPFPEIYIASDSLDTKTGASKEILVDGQQRITTLYEYFKASHTLKLSKDIRAYEELTEKEKKEFLEYTVVVRHLGAMPTEEIKLIFQKINSTSYGLNAMEIRNARYAGEFIELCEVMANDKFFEDHRVFTGADCKRMKDIEYCAGIISTLLSNYFDRDKEVEKFLSLYNDEFNAKQDVLLGIQKTFLFLNQLNISHSSRLYNKADFFSVFIELYRALIDQNKNLAIDAVRTSLDSFFTDVDRVPKGEPVENADAVAYYKAVLEGSNSRTSRILRGKALSNLLSRSN